MPIKRHAFNQIVSKSKPYPNQKAVMVVNLGQKRVQRLLPARNLWESADARPSLQSIVTLRPAQEGYLCSRDDDPRAFERQRRLSFANLPLADHFHRSSLKSLPTPARAAVAMKLLGCSPLARSSCRSQWPCARPWASRNRCWPRAESAPCRSMRCPSTCRAPC